MFSLKRNLRCEHFELLGPHQYDIARQDPAQRWIKKEEPLHTDVLDNEKKMEDILIIGDIKSYIGNENEDIVSRFDKDENRNDNGSSLLEL